MPPSIHPSLARPGSDFVQRFRREAQIAATLTHPNLIRVYDVVEKYGLNYLIMEYVSGETARQRVERKGMLSAEEGIRILFGASLGMFAAHKSGVIHRDLKPDNIMISEKGEVKIADLGLAKASDGHEMTKTHMLMGTPQYMPPEQFDHFKSVGPEADVYALGASLYYFLAGEDAIPSGSLTEVMRRVCDHPFPSLLDKLPELEPDIAAIITRCTAVAATDRFSHAGYLAQALKQLRIGAEFDLKDSAAGTVAARTTLVSPPPQRTLDKARKYSETLGNPEKQKTSLRGVPSLRVITAALALVTVCVILWAAMYGTRESPVPVSGGESPSSQEELIEEPTGPGAIASRLYETACDYRKAGDLDAALVTAAASLDAKDTEATRVFRQELTDEIRKRLRESVILESPTGGDERRPSEGS